MASFGTEVKNFIAAFSAGDKILGSSDDRAYKKLRNRVLKAKVDQLDDPENQKLDKDLKRARAQRLLRGPQMRPMHPAQVDALKARTDYYRQRQELLKNPPPGETLAPSAPMAPPGQGAIPGPQSELEGEDPEFMTGEVDPEMMDAQEEPTQYAARGGAIKHYADGGAVEDDTTDDELDDTTDDGSDDELDDDVIDGAIPEQGAAPQQTTQTSGDKPKYSAAASHDGALEGIKYAMKKTGSMEEGAVDVSSQSRMSAGRQAYGRRAMAAPGDLVAQAEKMIDPEGKLSQSERKFAAIGKVWEHYLAKGDVNAARAGAASMVQHYSMAYDRYSALAKVAAGEGDVDGTVRNILNAHANVVDGKDLKIEKTEGGKLNVKFTDSRTGKEVNKLIVSPDEMLKWATNGGIGSYESLIAQASGERAGLKGKAPKEERPPKLEDRDAAMSKVEEAAKTYPNADKDLAPAAHYLASQIVNANDMSAKDALDVTNQLATVGAPPTFKITPIESGGGLVKMADGRTVKLSRDALGNLDALRGKALVKYNADQKASGEKTAADVKRKALEDQRTTAAAAIPPGSPMIPRQTAPAPYGNPLTELNRDGRVSGRPSQPAIPMTNIEQINAARRSQGLPAITEDQLPR